MIKLFGISDRDFSFGCDKILKPLKAVVVKEDNGEYYLEIEAGTEYSEDLTHGRIITAPTPTGEQAFRIRNPEKTKKKISFKAYHVYYDSENYLIKDSYVVNKDCSGALNHLNAAAESPFTFSSDISTTDSYRCVRTSLKEAVDTVLEHRRRQRRNGALRKKFKGDNVLGKLGRRCNKASPDRNGRRNA